MGVSLHVLFFGIKAIFQLKLKDFFLAFAHLVVESLECGFEHADGGLERSLCFLQVVFDQDAADYLPAFAFSLEGLEVCEDEVVLPAFLLELDVALKDLGVLVFELVVVVGHFLRGRHQINIKFYQLYEISYHQVIADKWIHCQKYCSFT